MPAVLYSYWKRAVIQRPFFCLSDLIFITLAQWCLNPPPVVDFVKFLREILIRKIPEKNLCFEVPVDGHVFQSCSARGVFFYPSSVFVMYLASRKLPVLMLPLGSEWKKLEFGYENICFWCELQWMVCMCWFPLGGPWILWSRLLCVIEQHHGVHFRSFLFSMESGCVHAHSEISHR